MGWSHAHYATAELMTIMIQGATGVPHVARGQFPNEAGPSQAGASSLARLRPTARPEQEMRRSQKECEPRRRHIRHSSLAWPSLEYQPRPAGRQNGTHRMDVRTELVIHQRGSRDEGAIASR